MLKAITILATLFVAVTLNAQTVKPIYVVHVSLGNNQLAQNVVEELLRPNPNFQNRPVIMLRPNIDVQDNPFAVSKWGRQTGLTRPGNEIKTENTPLLNDRMLQWFEDLEAKDIHPEVFIINGHHLVGMGFESDDTWETKIKSQFGQPIELSHRNLYFPTIIKSKNQFPVMARFFDRIKLVFIGGCEGLANLEPKEFGISGRALSPEEIKAKIDNGQKKLMLGDAASGQGLEGYRDDLVRVYPGSYTAKSDDEICVDMVNRLHCETFFVNRILPDSGLWDGNHMYNMPYQMKRLFPNAIGVFGFNTPSPVTPGNIWKMAFNESRRKLQTDNFFQSLFSDEVSVSQKKEIIQRLRISWTKATQQLNGRTRNGQTINRISGSITPAFPELDFNGIFAYEAGAPTYAEAPVFAPYEIRDYREESAVAKVALEEPRAFAIFRALLPSTTAKISTEEITKMPQVKQVQVAAPVPPAVVSAPIQKAITNAKPVFVAPTVEKTVEKTTSPAAPKTLAERIRALEQEKSERDASTK